MIFLKEQSKYFDKIKELNKEIIKYQNIENIENIENTDNTVLNDNNTNKVYIETFGCTLNENDSEKILGILDKFGYIHTVEVENSDIIVFNTCCIRENAENRLFGRLGEVKKYADKGAIVIICGCMMQEIHMVEKVKRSYPFVRLVFGTHTLYKLPENLYNILLNDLDILESKNNNKNIKKLRIFDIKEVEGSIYEGIPTKHTHETSAFVPIIYGCNNFCTYCIVPYVRGRERSRKPEDILEEVRELVKLGYNEITLLGQNVNSYKGNNEIKNFADLLNSISKITGLEKIRFISPHPKDFTEDVAIAIKNNSNISRNLHYPLQSGSTKVLKEMNRKYTKEEYLDKAKMIRKHIPDVAFSTDIIVGFPGETEEDFKDTLDVVRRMNFEQIFMFIYSPREGTIAAKREDQIPYDIAQERFSKLQNLYEEMLMKKNDEYIGRIETIIIEEETSNNNEELLKGRTDSNKIIIIPKYPNWIIGDKIKVEVLENRKWYLKGRIIID